MRLGQYVSSQANLSRVLSVLCVLTLVRCGLAQPGATTQPYNEDVYKEHDLMAKLRPSGKVYVGGLKTVECESTSGVQLVPFPSSGIAIDISGLKEAEFKRYFIEGWTLPTKESLLSAGGSDFIVAVRPRSPSVHVLDQVFEPGYGPVRIDRTWIGQFKQNQTEFGSYLSIVSKTRNDVTALQWPESAKMLAIWENYVQLLLGSADNLTLYQSAHVQVVLCRLDINTRHIDNGKIFDRHTGKWLGDIMISQSTDTTDPIERLKRIIGRIQVPFDQQKNLGKS